MKKIIIRISVIILIILSIHCLIKIVGAYRIEIFINEGMWLPRADNINMIFRFEFRRGNDLSIWEYNKKNAKRLMNKKDFQQINEDNESFVKEKLDYYYSILSEEDKELFDKNVNINSIINFENYYALKTGEYIGSFFLFIFDYNSNKLFCFNSVA